MQKLIIPIIGAVVIIGIASILLFNLPKSSQLNPQVTSVISNKSSQLNPQVTSVISNISHQTNALTTSSNQRNDFGCFYSCDFFPSGYPKQMCQDWKAGRQVQWPSDCNTMQYGPCIKLCQNQTAGGSGSYPTGNYPYSGNYPYAGNYPSSGQAITPLPTTSIQNTGIPANDPNPDNVYIYINDYKHNRTIRINDMSGKNWTSFGKTGSGVGQLFNPYMLTLDSNSRIYIDDQNNNRIVRINNINGSGWISYGTDAGGAPAQPGQFHSPVSVRLDSQGRIYVVNQGNGPGVIRIDDMYGKNWTGFGTFGSGINQLAGPKGIALDSQGRIYVTDKCNYRIVRFDDMTGKNWVAFQSNAISTGPATNCGPGFISRAGNSTGQFGDEMGGIAIDKQGRIYVADEHNNRIIRMDDMSGKGWVEFHGPPNDQLSLPHDVVFGPTGRIYVTDTRNNRIVRFDDMNGTGYIGYGPYPSSNGGSSGGYPQGYNSLQMEAPKGIWISPR